MGKAQYRKKTAAKRHNPIRVPDAHLGSGKATGKADPAKERQLLPVLAKLKSPEYADRTWACAAICNLISNDPATRRLFQGKNVVGELVERLSDSVDEVVVEASGALRNLAIDGGHELCGEMFNKGIMPHLTALMAKISTTIESIFAASQPQPKLSDEQLQARKHLLALSENVITLIWSLAEASHKTLAAINAAGCEGLLIKVLEGREGLSIGVTLAAAQALYSLTQDNQPFRSSLLAHPTAVRTLVDISRQDHEAAERSLKGKGKAKGKAELNEDEEIGDGRALLTRVLVCGVLRNVVEPGSPADGSVDISATTNTVILPLVNSLLDVNLTNVIGRVSELVALVPQQDVALTGKDLKTDHRSPAEIKLERVERMLTTVVAALEVLTGICAGLEDVVDAEVEEEEPEDEEMEDALADEALIEMGRDPSAAVTASAPAPVVRAIATLPHLLGTLALPERLTALSILTPLSFPPTSSAPSLHPPTTAVLSTLHLRALEALNNLLLITVAASLATDAGKTLAPLVPAAGIWSAMFTVVQGAGGDDVAALHARGHEMRIEVIEMALGCLWGLAKVNPDQIPVQANEIQILMDVVGIVQSDAARTRCIDTLAALAARPGVSVEENRAIGSWLVQHLSPASSPPSDVLVAVINAIIDVYADEGRDYDRPVFVLNGFVDVLTNSVARVRSDVRKVDRRKLPELRDRADEAYENLVAFIKYRRSLRL